jgi:hypothetical protein
MYLKNKSHGTQPIFWKDSETGTAVWWTEQKSWWDFYTEVSQFCMRNGRPVPTDEEVQDAVCRQLGPNWCSNTPVSAPVVTEYSSLLGQSPGRKDCGTCGGR